MQLGNRECVKQANLQGSYTFFQQLYSEWNNFTRYKKQNYYLTLQTRSLYNWCQAWKILSCTQYGPLSSNQATRGPSFFPEFSQFQHSACHGCATNIPMGSPCFCHYLLDDTWADRFYCLPCIKYICMLECFLCWFLVYHLQALKITPLDTHKALLNELCDYPKLLPRSKFRNSDFWELALSL